MSTANTGNVVSNVVTNTTADATPPAKVDPKPPVVKTGAEVQQPAPAATVSKLGADLMLPAFLIAMVALNLAVLILLSRMLGGLTLRGALVEKDPAVVEDTTAALVASHKVAADAAVAMAQAQAPALLAAASGGPGAATVTPVTAPNPVTPQNVADALPASYSRIAGAFGAIVLAAALYGLANYIIWAAFFAPDKISSVLDKMGSFFLAGSALFAPYAVNQLTSIFPRQPAGR